MFSDAPWIVPPLRIPFTVTFAPPACSLYSIPATTSFHADIHIYKAEERFDWLTGQSGWIGI